MSAVNDYAVSLVFPISVVRSQAEGAAKLPDALTDIRIGCIAGNKRGMPGALMAGTNGTMVSVASAFGIQHNQSFIVRCKLNTLERNPMVIQHANEFLRVQTLRRGAFLPYEPSDGLLN